VHLSRLGGALAHPTLVSQRRPSPTVPCVHVRFPPVSPRFIAVLVSRRLLSLRLHARDLLLLARMGLVS
jgi:hypothetical protein